MIEAYALFLRRSRLALGLVGVALTLHAAEPVPTTAATAARDTLVFKDGDRMQGRFVERSGEVIVFKTDRFGEVRVPAAEAEVVLAAATAPPATLPAHRHEEAEEEAGSVWHRFSPRTLTADVREFFGPWHGRFAFATEMVSDTKERESTTLEGKLQRKWDKEDVLLNARYDFSQTNGLATTDVVKGDAAWRHDLPRHIFSQYRPSLEWNRASFHSGQPSDYVLAQQELGAGLNLANGSDRKLRLGLAENLFDVWTLEPTDMHSSRAVESAFVESEWKLPWRLALTQRSVWYAPVRSDASGWENRIELNKKLTETLSASVRHEARRNNPDVRVQDYARLKLLVGLDF